MTRIVCRMISVFALAAFLAEAGQAQTRTAEPETVRIRKLNGLAGRSVVTTPIYASNVGRSARPPREWLEVQVVYDTAPAWLDELVVEYFVMMMDRVDGNNVYSLFKLTVRYLDVERERNHLGVSYLRPSALKRYGRVVAVAVEISHDGKVAATETDASIKLPPVWWRNPAVTENKELTVRDGYLVNKADSPFAFVNPDDYEVIK